MRKKSIVLFFQMGKTAIIKEQWWDLLLMKTVNVYALKDTQVKIVNKV